MSVTVDRKYDIFVITIDNPPVNALGNEVRRALDEALVQAQADPACSGIVINGGGTLFSCGADIREFDTPSQSPFLPDVIGHIENCNKPVAAAIHGAAMGGALELALGCHLRIAVESSQLSLPEVKLGLLPGAGGTQRLPRLIGLAASLDMLTTGAVVDAQKALDLGLIDAVVVADQLINRSIAEVRDLLNGARAPRRTLDIAPPSPTEIDNACDAFLSRAKFKGAIAPEKVVQTVRDGLKQSAQDGLVIDRAVFADLRDSSQAQASRYSFFSDRQATRVPALDGVTPRAIDRVGIVGSGLMGSGIAITLLSAGIPITIYEQSADALERAKAFIAKTLARNAASGRLSARAAAAAETLSRTTIVIADLADVDLIIEAASETMEVKTMLFSALADIAKVGAILASNTSYLDIDQIAAATNRPQDVVGLHFFSPANIMKLLEIVKGRQTAPDVLLTALGFAKRIGKTAVLAGNAHGFIGNRMLAVRNAQAENMIVSGNSPYDVDNVMEKFGMPMGPFRTRDLAGLDLGWNAEGSRGATIRDRLCEAGRRGQKTGAGFYDYDEMGRPQPSAAAEAIIARYSADGCYPSRMLNDDDVLDRLLLPMINEGVRILAQGKALRGSDVDVVWRGGYGWPTWLGGPMFWAQNQGLVNIVARLEAMDIVPEPLLVDIAETGGNITEYTNVNLRN